MNPSASYNFKRTLVAVAIALFFLCVVLPIFYDLAGVRTNLEERIVPTLVAESRRKTRIPRTPTPIPGHATLAPLPTDEPTPIPGAPLPTVAALNGIPVEKLVLISDAARAHMRDIYALGQSLGRNPRTVSKVGDSTMVWPPFLETFDEKTYKLGKFGYLQGTIEYHAGSFGRDSVAVRKGMHTWSQFDPDWAVSELCGPSEGPLACELRVHNPSIAIIRLGANDTEYPYDFERNLSKIVKFCLDRGIIPVLGTKPDRYEGESNLINNLIRKTASAYSIPLWDYDLIAGTIPGRGLEQDGLHMLGGGTRNFTSGSAMRAGDALEDLTALMLLHAIQEELGTAP